MSIKFSSSHSPSIIMLTSTARQLVKLMGHSGTVPGALGADDLTRALASLKSALQSNVAIEERNVDQEEFENDDDRPIPLQHRALPLTSMLERAIQHNDFISWE